MVVLSFNEHVRRRALRQARRRLRLTEIQLRRDYSFALVVRADQAKLAIQLLEDSPDPKWCVAMLDVL